MRSLFGRGLRLALIGTGIAMGSMALSVPALAAPVTANTDALPTQTRLDAETRVVARNGRNFTTGLFTVAVTGADGHAASGAVTLEENGKAIGGAVLNAEGKAEINADLVSGHHAIEAVYQGDAVHAASTSAAAEVTAEATESGTPDFSVALDPASLTVTQGESIHATVSLTPINSSSLSAPMFVTLSCSGLPDQSTCTFTPQNVQIEPKETDAVTSDMVLATQTGSSTSSSALRRESGLALAILLPGAAGLIGLSLRARKSGLARLGLIAFVAIVTSFGMTACNPRYSYYNHGPLPNLPTPAGTYQMKVTAQSTNGVTATTHSAQFVLTVNAASSN